MAGTRRLPRLPSLQDDDEEDDGDGDDGDDDGETDQPPQFVEQDLHIWLVMSSLRSTQRQ